MEQARAAEQMCAAEQLRAAEQVLEGLVQGAETDMLLGFGAAAPSLAPA